MRIRRNPSSRWIGALLLAGAAATAAFAQPPGGGPRGQRGMHGHGRDGQALLELLNLDEQQRQAWRDAHRAHFESLRPTFEKIRDLREQNRTELESGSPDATTIGSNVIAIHELDESLDAAREDLDAAIREILDDEQETKLEAWKAAHPERRHGPGGHGSRRGGPRPGGGGPHGDDEA